SMTGFGKGLCENERWRVSAFVKSLNGKGLDVFIKSNYNLMELEFTVRRLVKEFVKRGTVSVHIEVERKDIIEPVNIERLVANLQFFRLVRDRLNLSVSDDTLLQLAVRLSDQPREEIDPELEEVLSCAVTDALKELLNRRSQEGVFLKEDIESRLRKIESLLERISAQRESVYEATKRRVVERAKELGLAQDSALVLNEIALVLSKIDVEEEITRIRSHIERAKEVIKKGEEAGKRLEFILQEMHREINTLGSKLPDLSPFVVEVKTEIDRLKQQVANIE
ncbi:MAG: DUF1732 domain-containing protein, partial [Aquificota bacterium]